MKYFDEMRSKVGDKAMMRKKNKKSIDSGINSIR
jgi:hypothetical protein